MELDRREFLRGAAALGVGAFSPWTFARKYELDYPLTGSGEFTYEVVHDWLTPPFTIKYGDTHGLARDSAGRLYLAHTVRQGSYEPHAICVFDAEGRFVESWGAEFAGGAHGLDVRQERSEEFLYHCDTRRRLIVKTDLKGKPVWQRGMPKDSGVYPSEDKWCPTNVAFLNDGDFLVGDGYGSSFIHRYSANGDYKGIFAKPGSGVGQVSCPHGLWMDNRSGEMLVADRSNRRIQRFDLSGNSLGMVTEGIRLPCHFKTNGDLLLVPDLESVVTVLGKDNKPVAKLGDGHPTNLRGKPRDQYIPGKFIHPHTAIWVGKRDILVAEWVPDGRITLLRNVHDRS